MGLLDLLFGKKKTRKQTSKSLNQKVQQSAPNNFRKVQISTFDDFVKIPSISFFGEYKTSPSGVWLICWSDSDSQSSTAGHRYSGHGRYVLYNKQDEQIVTQGKLERPNNGHVANNGTFSIEDWHFGDDLSGTFYVMSSSDMVLVKKTYSANIYHSALSENGVLAVCQTANAPGEDGNILTGFSITESRELFRMAPPSGWADTYQFEEQKIHIGFVYKGLGTFFCNAKGELLDPDALENARLKSRSHSIAVGAAEEIVKSETSSNQSLEKAIKATARVLKAGAGKDEYLEARAFKVNGLAHERLGNEVEALSSFNAALAINPKIGVKRKATAIQKRLDANNSK